MGTITNIFTQSLECTSYLSHVPLCGRQLERIAQRIIFLTASVLSIKMDVMGKTAIRAWYKIGYPKCRIGSLSPDITETKMKKNLGKALHEHKKSWEKERVFLPLWNAVLSLRGESDDYQVGACNKFFQDLRSVKGTIFDPESDIGKFQKSINEYIQNEPEDKKEFFEQNFSLESNYAAALALRINEESNRFNPVCPYATESELTEDVSPEALKFDYAEQTDIGTTRKTNEDAHLIHDSGDGLLLGVLDGHSGSSTSNYVAEHFRGIFFECLSKTNPKNHVFEAFEIAIRTMQEQLENIKYEDGTTAVFTYVDKSTNIAYTATVGDSEANVYRQFEESTKCIPLSPIRDFSSPRDAMMKISDSSFSLYKTIDGKLTKVVNPNMKICKEILEDHAATIDPKELKGHALHPVEGGSIGLNVSRSLGDLHFASAGVIKYKPKITATRLKAGDTLILTCDGVIDYSTEKERIGVVSKNNEPAKVVEDLIEVAKKGQRFSGDNITAIVVNVVATGPCL